MGAGDPKDGQSAWRWWAAVGAAAVSSLTVGVLVGRSSRDEPDASESPPAKKSFEIVPRPRHVLNRGLAWSCVIASIVAAAAGGVGYALMRPEGDLAKLTLRHTAKDIPLPAGVPQELTADLVLIAGYGIALVLCTVVLAPAMLRRQTTTYDIKAVPPDGEDGAAAAVPPAPGGRPATELSPVARALRPLALLGIGADLVEDLLMWVATRMGSEKAAGRWLEATSALAVLKWTCLVPAVIGSIAVLSITVRRLLAHRCPPPNIDLGVRPPDPLEGDPAGRPGERDPDPGLAGRWLRGYQEPSSSPGVPGQIEPVLGFCLSGGGIRSASVALGALQCLRAELRRARYLVSVSGGGYTAGALQLALTDAADPKHPSSGKRMGSPETVYEPGSVEEDRLRRHARYLADTPGQMLAALGLVVRVLLLSVVVVFSPALVLGVAIGAFYWTVELAPIRDTKNGELHWPHPPLGTWWLLAVLVALALVAYLLSLAVMAYSDDTGDTPRHWARRLTVLAVLVALFALGMPWLIYGGAWLLGQTTGHDSIGLVGPLGGVVLTYALTLITFFRKHKLVGRIKGLFSKKAGDKPAPVAAVPGGALQLLLVALTLVLLAAVWLLLIGGAASLMTTRNQTIAGVTALILFAALVLLGLFLDQTALSLHPFYRRHLADAFAARRIERAEDRRQVAEGYSYGEPTQLQDYGRRVADFPEVIFAAAANLTGERRAPLKATSFTMSADWVGGPDVGYVKSRALYDVCATAIRRDLTVQAAMAVSGAAIASAAGRQTRWFNALLAISGMRLGTWLPNPVFMDRWLSARAADDWTQPDLPRLRRLTYLFREVLGIHRWTDRLLQVTDGGHYENLGLVEVLRRRCTEIYCIDASGDTPPTAGTFAEAITLAYAELGVRVVPREGAWNRLVPGGATPFAPPDPLQTLNARLSECSVLTADISYPAESGLQVGHRNGVLVFAKASLTPKLPYELLSYATQKGNEVFPYDSTGDQFFDDGKFTAYTGLGRAIGLAARDEMEAARSKQPKG